MPSVRAATEGDLSSILAIYNEVIATSTAVYALEPATLDERRAWFESRSAMGFPVMVATDPGGVRCMSETTFVDRASDAPLLNRYFLWLSASGST